MQNDHSKNPMIQLSIEFSMMVIKYAEQLEGNNKHIIAEQVLRNGTSIGAYIMEAQSAESTPEYYDRMRVADRKAHNTWYWIYLCDQMAGYEVDTKLTKKLEQIMQSLHSIIVSAGNAQ